MLLVSGCLAGLRCRFDGSENGLPLLLKCGTAFCPCCPEQLGGLPTPRKAAEIKGGDGFDVLLGRAKVVNEEGEDVTEAFLRGAAETLYLAKLFRIQRAILKEGSPSCGNRRIKDGSFKGVDRPGPGVTAALLKKNGIRVFSDKEPAARLFNLIPSEKQASPR